MSTTPTTSSPAAIAATRPRTGTERADTIGEAHERDRCTRLAGRRLPDLCRPLRFQEYRRSGEELFAETVRSYVVARDNGPEALARFTEAYPDIVTELERTVFAPIGPVDPTGR